MFAEDFNIADVVVNAVNNGYNGLNQAVIYEAMLDAGYTGGPLVIEATQETNPDVLKVEVEADRYLSGEVFEGDNNE